MMKILSIGCIVLCTVVIAYVVMIYMESKDYKRPDKHKQSRRPY